MTSEKSLKQSATKTPHYQMLELCQYFSMMQVSLSPENRHTVAIKKTRIRYFDADLVWNLHSESKINNLSYYAFLLKDGCP